MRSRPTLTIADAHKMMAACKTEAQNNDWLVAIAIVDDAGALLLLERDDTIHRVTAEAALGKAQIAVALRRSSRLAMDLVKEQAGFLKVTGLPVRGGVPVMYQGECIGGVGVSGVEGLRDEQIAVAGANVFTSAS
jgi:glc operon protein GlcG